MAWNELRHRAKLVKNYSKVPRVDANESRLGQVFLNLIVNAAQAIPQGNYDANEIRIATASTSPAASWSTIRDTGSGIPPEVRPRLFTPFFTHQAGRRRHRPRPRDLAPHHHPVRRHASPTTPRSARAPSSTSRCRSPAPRPRRSRPRRSGPRSPAVRRGNLLVIDDEESLAQAIRRFLSVEHDVDRGVPARATRSTCSELGTRYDVILCDLMMPQITGMELHAEVLRLDPAQAARIVFLTGGAFTPSARDFLRPRPTAGSRSRSTSRRSAG